MARNRSYSDGRKCFPAALAVLAIFVLLWLGRDYYGQLGMLRTASLSGVGCICLVHLCVLCLQGITLRVGLAPFSPGISTIQSIALSIAGSYANLILPRSGIATTAAYLNRGHGFKLTDFSSVLMVNSLLFSLSSCMLALVCVAWQMAQGAHQGGWLLSAVLGILLGGVLTFSLLGRISARYRGPGQALLDRLRRAVHRLAVSPYAWCLPVLHLVMALLRGLRLYAAFAALSIDVDPIGVCAASAFSDLAFVFSITPSALGFREAIIAITAEAMSTTAEVALSAAILDRLVFSLVVIILAQFVVARFVLSASRGYAQSVSSTTTG